MEYTFDDLAKKDAARCCLASLPACGLLTAGEKSPKPSRRALVSDPGCSLGTAVWVGAASRGPELCVPAVRPGLVGSCSGTRICAVRSGCTVRGINVYTSMCIRVHAGFCNATCLTLCCVICGLVSVFLTTFGNFPLSSYKCSQSVGSLAR